METFRITFFREDDPDEKSMGDTREVMGDNQEDAANVFKQAEPFATIVKVEQIQ
jgi:hypothetical protein